MFNFLKKLIKYTIVYPIAACAAIALVLVMTGYEPKAPIEVANTPAPVVAPVQAATTELPALHQQCFESKQAHGSEVPSIITANGKFGTHDDGDIWVGYTRKSFPNGALGESVSYYNVVALCRSNGVAY